MSRSTFEICAPGIDVDTIVKEVRQTVADKMKTGAYTDGSVARAERTNLANLKDEESFLAFYLECLRDAVFVDISDFDIYERRKTFSQLIIGLKRLIWKLLKFYTYRLWSQQNETNGLLLSAIEGTEERYREKLKEMDERVAAMEQQLKMGTGDSR